MSQPTQATQPEPAAKAMPVICVGYCAGGLVPLREIFKHLPATTGAAFVVIPHLPRVGTTHLPELIESWSKMPAALASTGDLLQPDHVYVIPPGGEVTLNDGLFVRPRSKTRGFSNVITIFLKSLAQRRSHKGIAVILSGMDANGAAALREFKQHGGIVIAQDPKTAEFPGMPAAAIETGVVDYVLAPEAIAPRIRRLMTPTLAAGE